jgi:(d)CTP diphosphatase
MDESAIQIAAAVLLRPDGRVLLLKRSDAHTTNAGKWCFVTGYVKPQESPRDAAIRELKEELGIDASPSQRGDIVVVHTDRGVLHVHPFLFPVEDFEVRLEREHTDYTWIKPPEIFAYDIVQQLDEDLVSLGLLQG